MLLPARLNTRSQLGSVGKMPMPMQKFLASLTVSCRCGYTNDTMTLKMKMKMKIVSKLVAIACHCHLDFGGWMLDVMSVSVLILNNTLQLELDFINNQTKEKATTNNKTTAATQCVQYPACLCLVFGLVT